MSSRTRSSDGAVGLLLLVFLLSCGGKTQRVEAPPTPPVETPPRAAGAKRAMSGGWSGAPPPGTPAPEQVAPPPQIRAGLTTQAEAVHLTSSLPMRMHAGSRWLTSHDVLIEREAGAVGEGRSYTVQIASFLERSAARDLLASIEEDTGVSGHIRREPVTGRFAVRMGSWTSREGARASREGFLRMGYEAARVVEEPTAEGRPRGLILRRVGERAVTSSELSLLVLPAGPGAWVEVDGAAYRGYIEVSLNASNRFTVINVLNLEDYLKGVVPAELSPAVYPQIEAIKAQAVAARTYAVRHRGQFAAEGFDICTTPACQVYKGVGVEQPMSNEAVVATRASILTYGGQPIEAMYTSTCGGRTEDVQNVFDGPPQPYLVSRPCFVEGRAWRIDSPAPFAPSLEAAGAIVLGIVRKEELSTPPAVEAVSPQELALWVERALEYLGQRHCEPAARTERALSVAGFTSFLTEAFCWEGRLPYLVSGPDVQRIVPAESPPGPSKENQRALAYWVRQGWWRPPPQGLRPDRSVSRLHAVESLYRLVADRGEPPLEQAVVIGREGDDLLLRADDTERRLSLARQRFLFMRVGGSTYATSSLWVFPGDRVRFHAGEDGIDLLVLVSRSTGFDQSSRFYRWSVRKNRGELSERVNARVLIGELTELRPRRYGRSGRVIEMEIVGAERTVTVRGLAIRQWLGLRENLFFVDRQVGPDGNVVAWVFTGGGWGHGVGLCQVGAYGMAASGYDYGEILGHYYPGTEIRNIGEPADEPQR